MFSSRRLLAYCDVAKSIFLSMSLTSWLRLSDTSLCPPLSSLAHTARSWASYMVLPYLVILTAICYPGSIEKIKCLGVLYWLTKKGRSPPPGPCYWHALVCVERRCFLQEICFSWFDIWLNENPITECIPLKNRSMIAMITAVILLI
jgi:hypothetical protein